MEIRLPHLGEGADSGTVVNVFVTEGDRIEKDQPIIELENEKAVATIPSTAAGTVGKIFVKTREKISVGQPILSSSDPARAAQPEPKPQRAATKPVPDPVEEPPAEQEKQDAESHEPQPKAGVAPAAAPSIRKLARDLGIDL